jgi:hypothetical protein
LLSNGDGTFTRGGPATIRRERHAGLAVADFNGDGNADLAVSHLGNEVSMLLGNGEGGFRKVAIGSAVENPQALAVGDFNSDGVKDLAVISLPDKVAVLLGWGDGTFRQVTWNYEFEPGPGPPSGTNRTSVALGEFNRDGIQDLAVITDGLPFVTSRVRIMLGNGDGSFRYGVDFEAYSYAFPASDTFGRSLAVGEFNGDGIQDIVVPGVAVFLGNGNGSFQPALNFPAAGSFITVGYFNGDGFQDVAVLSSLTSKVSVLLGNGDGTFRAPLQFDMGVPAASSRESGSIAVGDFNSDGREDLVASTASAAGVSVLLGNGDGTFRAPLIIGTGARSVFVAVGDFNNDRIEDLAVANISPNNVSVLLGNGNGTFNMPLILGVGGQPASLAVGDFNGDGIQDLAVSSAGITFGFISSGRVSVLPGNGNGTFQPATDFVTAFANSLAVGDFRGDHRPDIAAFGGPLFFEGYPHWTLSIMINDTP